MAKKNIPPDEENQSNQPVDPTSERRSLSAAGPDEDLQALMAQVAAIQVKVDKFDFDQFAIDVRVELEAWKDEIRHLLHELEAQMQADRKSFKDLKDLLAKAEALIAKIPVAGDLVKEVLAALSGWQGQINGDLTALRERVQLVENRLTQIGTLLDDHQARIKRLEDQGLDPEAIRLKVLESLAGWRQEVKDALDALRQQQQNHTGQINQLTAGLEELKKQLATIDFDNLRPEVIRQKVLEALAAWQQQVNATLDEFKAKLSQADTLLANLADKLEKTNKRLDVLENNVRVIESAVNELRKMLEKIISNPQDPELIKRIIKEILEAWQHDVETRLQSHDTDIQFLKNKLNDLLVILEKIIAQPPVDPETIKRQILDALRSWQQQVTNDLTSLGKRTTANEAAITNLQSGLTDLAQKVRELAANGSANVEKVRQELLAALAELEKRLAAEIAKLNARAENGEAGLRSLQAALEALRHQISSDLASLKTRVDNGDTNLTALRAALNELARRLEEIAAKVPNPQDLVKFVFAALAAWQRQMEGKVSGLETKYAGLKTDLEALINRVNDLILNPPTNPEEIQKLIAKTLEDIKAKISGIEGRVDGLEKELHAFILKVEKILNSAGNIEEVRKELLKAVDDLGKRLQTEIDGLKTRIGNGDTLITAIQNNLTSLTVRIEEVAKTVVNPAELKKQILEALAEWQLQIVNDLSGLKTKVQNAETAITALQAALARLAARVEDLIKKGVDEEEVKRIIQQVLTVTLKQIYAEFEIHKDRIENSENEITNLQAALRRLGARIEEIAQSGTDAASVRKDLLAALAALDQQLGGRITVLDGKVADGKSAIEALQTALRDLSLRVDKIVLATTPEEIRNLIIDFISKWEIEIKNAVEAEHKRNEEDRISLRLLRTEINKLRERIDDLSETLEIEKIVRKVIAWLQKWQDTLTQRVDEVTTQSNTVAKAVAVLSAKTTDLTTQVGLDGQAIARLTSELAALVLRFNALPPIPTTQEVANQTLILLQTWQNGLEILVNKINTDHTQIRIELNGLGKGLQVLADKVNSLPPVPALSVIVHAVLDALSTWKTGLETRIQALADAQTQTNNRIGELAGDITETGNAVSDLTTRVDTAEGSITGLDGRLGQAETALEAGEQRDETLEKAVEDLQKQIDEWKPENDDDTAVRLARKCLTGRGIVCGFHVQYTPNFTVKITGGTGVTSDGHLITTSGSLHFTHYREFQHTADYSWFVRKNKTLPVWEMLLEKDDESSADVRALTPQQARHLRQPFIQDKVVLVLLDPKNSAPERENARGLRYLLMRQDDVAAILQAKGRLDRLTGMHPDEDDVWAETFSEADEKPTESDLYQTLRPELLLLEIDLPRFGFYQGKDCSPDDLDNTNFPNPLSLDELYKTYDPIIHDTIETLSDQFGQLADLYHELLFPQVPVEEYKKAVHLLSAKWAAYQTYNERHESDGEAKLFYIQYFYDWMRDLVNAYHELRNELLQLMAVCCSHDHGPQSYHPRHLMLGLAWREEDYGLASPLRHEFQQPPIYNSNAARLETCRLYLRRWMIMVREFYLPDYSDDESVNRFCKHEHPDPPPMDALKITPGRFYDHPLSEQTIPYYYPVTQGTQSVHRFWNYRRAKTCTESRLLSYHANDSQDSYTSDPATIRPLFYLLDAYDFYRVEGHIGEKWENWDEVVSTDGTTVHHEGIRTKLTELQRKFNLDFDIIEIDIALMVEQYPPDPATPEFNTLIKKIQGAEHTAGVPKGGTFILVTEKDAAGVKNIVWDLSLPYRCCGGLEVEASVGECYEGEANVTLRVSSPHSMDNSFKVLLDGTEIPDSPYQYSESPVQFPIPSDGLEHRIEVSEITKITAPADCSCELTLEPVVLLCENGISQALLTVKAENTGDSAGFDVLLNDVKDANSPFPYGSPANVILPVIADPNATIAVKIQDAKKTECKAETTIKVSDIPTCVCSLDVTVSPPSTDCFEGKKTVRVTVTPINPAGDSFQIFLDDEDEPYGTYLYEFDGSNNPAAVSIPIDFPTDNAVHKIKVQDADDATCVKPVQTERVSPCPCALRIKDPIVLQPCVPGQAERIAEITVEVRYPGDSTEFNVILDKDDGRPFGPFKYTDKALIPVSPRGTHTFRVQDAKDQNCFDERQGFDVQPCCSLEILDAQEESDCRDNKRIVHVVIRITSSGNSGFNLIFDEGEPQSFIVTSPATGNGTFDIPVAIDAFIANQDRDHKIVAIDVNNPTCRSNIFTLHITDCPQFL